jgi:Leucine-rich repeat (LRR) protein
MTIRLEQGKREYGRWILLLSLFVGQISTAASTLVPDTGLESAIRQQLNKGSNEITVDDLRSLGFLDGYSRGISNLVGLEWATNLTHLWLSFNSMRDVSPLTNAPLLDLDLTFNSVSNVHLLTQVRSLRLVAQFPRITNLTFLTTLTNLRHLAVDLNDISDLTPLYSMPITSLSASYNAITNIHGIQQMPLEFLDLSGNRSTEWVEDEWSDTFLSDFDPLWEIPTLVSLALSELPLTNPPALPQLQTLYMNACGFTDFWFATNCPQLTFLSLTFNSITNVTPLLLLTNLKWCFLGGNHLTDIAPLTNDLHALMYLDIQQNRLPLTPGSPGRIILTNVQERGIFVYAGGQHYSPRLEFVKAFQSGTNDFLRFRFNADPQVLFTIQLSTNLVQWFEWGHVQGGDDIVRDVYLPAQSPRWFLKLSEW